MGRGTYSSCRLHTSTEAFTRPAEPAKGASDIGGLNSLAPSRSVVSDSFQLCTVAFQAPWSVGLSRQEYCSGLPFLLLESPLKIYDLKKKFIITLFLFLALPDLRCRVWSFSSCGTKA